jgi:glycosyltransferase involved in cell wall biosynthesis
LPMVATNVVGNRDLVEPGKTGFLVRDVPGFLSALQALADTPSLRRAMGDAGRERVLRDYDQKRLGTRWLDLYEEVRTAPRQRGESRPAPAEKPLQRPPQ